MPKNKKDVLNKISGVEIFAAGKWNGDKYTVEDLDHMIKAFSETSGQYTPYLKLGHDEDQKLLQKDGLPAAGWIGRVYRNGEKLLADFIDIPDKIFKLLKNKAYKKVSSEIYWNIDFNGKKYKRLLSGVALLGSNMPAVSTLDDILNLYGVKDFEAIKNYKDMDPKVYEFSNEITKAKTYGRLSNELNQCIDLKIAEGLTRRDIIDDMSRAANISVSMVEGILNNMIDINPHQLLGSFADVLGKPRELFLTALAQESLDPKPAASPMPQEIQGPEDIAPSRENNPLPGQTFTNKTKKTENKMSKTEKEIKLEMELTELREKSQKVETEAKSYKADVEKTQEELTELKEYKTKIEKEKAQLLAEKTEAENIAFIKDLLVKDLATPAMKPYILELLGEDKKEYSIKLEKEEKKYSKKELLETLLKLHAASDVNLEENSEDAYPDSKSESALDKKIQDYADKNKVSYSVAYKSVLKNN